MQKSVDAVVIKKCRMDLFAVNKRGDQSVKWKAKGDRKVIEEIGGTVFTK